MPIITTDALYTGQGQIVLEAWLSIDGGGVLEQWGTGPAPGPVSRHLEGLCFGGMVNAHCHLELSHLKGRIPERTGMAGFVQSLQAIRAQEDAEAISRACMQAAREMWGAGITAVADICNGLSTREAKSDGSPITYHNFIEVFGSNPGRADEIFDRALDLSAALGPRASITLHAPYSVSAALRDKVQAYAQAREWPQSVHLLESVEERRLFEHLDGPLMDMLRSFGVQFQGHTAATSMQYIMPGQPKECPTMMVHVTEITPQEVQTAMDALGANAFFVLCPNANQYIHGTLPRADMLLDAGAQVCLGTDSLAGNHALNLWSEMATLQDAFGIPTSTLLLWAVDNGARALRLDLAGFIPVAGRPFRLLQLANFDPATGRIPSQPIVKHIEP